MLECYFNSLRYYRYTNKHPKSNVLTIINILNNYSFNEQLKELDKYAKYKEYVSYIVSSSKEKEKLFKEFTKILDEKSFKDRKDYVNVLDSFFYHLCDGENDDKYSLLISIYSFLCDGNLTHLDFLEYSTSKENVVKIIEGKTNYNKLLEKLYSYYEIDDKLYELLVETKQQEKFIKYIDILKEKYENEMIRYFKNTFFRMMNSKEEALNCIIGIFSLDNGKEKVLKFMEEIKMQNIKDEELFDEINKIIEIHEEKKINE